MMLIGFLCVIMAAVVGMYGIISLLTKHYVAGVASLFDSLFLFICVPPFLK